MLSQKFSATRRNWLKAGAAAGAAALTGGFSAPTFAQNKTLKIGYISPRSGPLALFGEADSFILSGVREALKNGVQSGGKTYPVTIVTKDTQSNPNRAADATNELISSDKVDLVLAIAAPEMVNPISDQCELNGIPCISSIAPWQAWLQGRGSTKDKGFESTFHFFWGFEDITAVYANMWDMFETNHKAGVLLPNDEDGRAWGNPSFGPIPMLKARHYEAVSSGTYRDLTDDFSSVIATFKNAGCQIVTGAPIPPDFTTFWTQARQQGFHPKIVTIAKALLFPAALEALGDAGHNLSTEIWWSPDHPFASSLTGTSAGKLAAGYSAATGKQWTQPLGFVHALFEIAVDVFKRSTDVKSAQSVIEAIRATTLDTIVGKVDWKTSQIKNVARTPLVGGQWRLRKGEKNKYDLFITSNATAPVIKTTASMEALAA